MTAVLVTGASGFVGRALCAALGLQGHLVRSATRTSPEGSENLARQAACAGLRRFVFLSSVKVNGKDSAEHAFVETDPVMPMDAYGLSKAEAEKRLRIISTETGMEVVVVRPQPIAVFVAAGSGTDRVLVSGAVRLSGRIASCGWGN